MKKIVKYIFQLILISILSFKTGVFAINFLTSDKIEYKDNKTVKDELDYLYSNINFLKNLDLEFLDSNLKYDMTHSTLNYTAQKKEELLVVGVGTSSHTKGDSNATLTTTGKIKTLVDGVKISPASTSYFKTYIYQVTLSAGESLNFELWSNQGNTSNVTLLFSIQ